MSIVTSDERLSAVRGVPQRRTARHCRFPGVSTQLRWTDDHCHLGWGQSEGLDESDGPTDGAEADEAVAEARAAGVERMITVGTDATRSAQAVAIGQRHPGVVWATVGLHPHEARHGLDGIQALLKDVDLPGPDTSGSPVVAIGECGLDYYYEHSPRSEQREMFAAQIALAHELDLTLVIHTRDAWADTFEILDAEGVPPRTVLHCFTGGPDEAQRCLERGMYISFSGIVTFKRADDVRAASVLCPLDRLLVETDSPYLAPTPHRGKTNQPAWLPLVGTALAAAKDTTIDQIAEATWANASTAYRL